MLGQCLRRWLNIEPTLHKCTMFERKSSRPANTRHLYNIYSTSAQRLRRRSSIAWSHTNVLCLLGVDTSLGSSSFYIPAVIQPVCLQASDQVGARAKGFELLTHRYRSSIYELAVIWELALNEASGMKRIFSIRTLAYPRALLPSGGPLSREFWQLTTPLIN